KDESIAFKRFGVIEGGIGICYTRTGRRFFDDLTLETAFLERIRDTVTNAGLWEELNTDWLALDCELMPWSAKAQELLKGQYAAVGSASRAALADVVDVLGRANERYAGMEVAALGPLLERHVERLERAGKYVEAYRRYCWPVRS